MLRCDIIQYIYHSKALTDEILDEFYKVELCRHAHSAVNTVVTSFVHYFDSIR